MKLNIKNIQFIIVIITLALNNTLYSNVKEMEFDNIYNSKEDSLDVKSSKENWRIEAEERIEQYRKGNTTLRIRQKDGKAYTGRVKIEQVSHNFRFGGIIKSSLFISDKQEMYKSIFKSSFEHAGFENLYKIKHQEKAAKVSPEIIKWLDKEGISLRGHALVWEGKKFVPTYLKKAYEKKDTTKLIKEMENYSKFALKNYNAIEWDVLNEPRDNQDLNKITANFTLSHWFIHADKYRKSKDVKLFINENKVVSSPYKMADRNIKIYRKNIEDILDKGAPLEAIGFQTRFRQYIKPEDIFARLNIFDQYNLPMLATEFEIIDNNLQTFSEEERAKFTEEVMTVYFSHPNVIGIYCWTPFSDDPKALFTFDGVAKKNGKVWNKQIEKWTSKLTSETNSEGLLEFRGFKGEYKITIDTKNGKEEYIISCTNPENNILLEI